MTSARREPHGLPRTTAMTRRCVLLLLAWCGGAVCVGGGEAPPHDVIPCPKEVRFDQGAFALDGYSIVLVSSEARRGTRRAARAIQLGIRHRYGLDLPIVRIADLPKHGVARPIWVVEPRLLRPPSKTVGVRGAEFTDEMFHGGYYLRVDAVEAVVHGANDAGSLYGAHTLLQLIRPPRRPTLFRRRRPPSIPCLWIRDWPSARVRGLGDDIELPPDPAAAERVLKLAASYKLNALREAALPPGADAARRIRELAARCQVAVVGQVPSPAPSPLAAPPAEWAQGPVATRYALAARAEVAWGPPDPDLATFRRRVARHAAAAKPLAHAAGSSKRPRSQEQGEE